MVILEPTAILLSKVSISEPFSTGLKTIISFLKNAEEQWDPVQIIQPVFSKEVELKLQEYVLFCFLEITHADINTLHDSLSYKRLHQLQHRRNNYLFPCSEKEIRILNNLREQTGIETPATLEIASRACSNWANLLLNFSDIGNRARMQFASLLQNEASALRERIMYLSDNVDTYNMKAIARLLPLLTMCDEYAKAIDDLGLLILHNKQIGTPILYAKQLMKHDHFDKLLTKLSRSSELRLFYNAVDLQCQKLIPTQKLLAAATLCRWVNSKEESPLQWVIQALEFSNGNEFRIDAGNSIALIRPFLANSGVEISDSILRIDFNKGSLSTLIGTDMLTRAPAAEKEISIPDLVARSMSNDLLLIRLLDNPKVYNSPGIVEKIVTRSRSLSVLQKVTSTRELYTGHANSGVPLALLRNPTNIPISQLRMFINPTYISVNRMKDLLKNPYGVRRDVFTEVKSFVERKR